MDRKAIMQLPSPKGTDSWKPVPHIELIETLESVLKKEDMKISDEKFGVGRKGKILFGVIKMDYKMIGGEGTASLGLRQANDRTMSIQICAGLSVFVCDNLVFRGDLIALRRKHTNGLNLVEEVTEAVGKLKEHLGLLDNEVAALKKRTITDDQAKVTMHDIFADNLLPVRLLPEVAHNYFIPPHPEFEPRTLWSLHNAFTEAAKQMPITTRVVATQRIGKKFGMAG